MDKELSETAVFAVLAKRSRAEIVSFARRRMSSD